MVDPKEKYEEGELTPHNWKFCDWVKEAEPKWRAVRNRQIYARGWNLGG